jgi:tRNA pseudouridine38-40 synthase
MYRAGLISQDNHLDFGKIKWSRSSRTDKGVHASKMIIGVKLVVQLSWLGIDHKIHRSDSYRATDEQRRLSVVVKQLNDLLPDDIRVFSCTKVNQAFNARISCHWREYEYILPVEALMTSELREEVQQINSFNQSLQKYLGSQSFHNFHRLGAKNVLNPNNRAAAALEDLRENDEEMDEVEESVESDEVELDDKALVDLDMLYDDISRRYYSSIHIDDLEKEARRYSLRQRLIAPKTYTCIYHCQVHDVIEINNQRFCRIIIRGKSFLLQ